MVRTQIQLDEKQLQALRQASSETGRSIADLVREGVELYLKSQRRPSREEQVRRALAASGKFASGTTDTSARHDHYLAQAFGK
ncbi:MAG: ribbon-helix-helix domain-containing protein [Bryobacteraceae bacterium]|jgi:ribbon-helix-helix protein